MIDLPTGWELATVGSIAESICDGPFGSNLKTEHYQARGVRVIRLQNIADGHFDDTDKAYISEDHADKLKRHEARPGDVLIAAMGDVLPRVCLMPANIESAIVKADCFRLRPRKEILSEYITYVLSAPQTRKRASTQIAGVGRPRLNLKKVSALEIPLPSRVEQERIVSAIEAQFSRLDSGVAALQSVARKLRRIRAAVLQAAITGNLIPPDHLEPSLAGDLPFISTLEASRNLPSNWVTTSIGSLGSVTSGATPSRGRQDYWRGGSIPWITSALINDETISAAREYITPIALKETSVKLIPPGALLVAMYGEGQTRGRCSELLIEATTNQACAAIVLNEKWEFAKPFIKLFLTASYEENRRLSSGGVQPNLSVGIIKRLLVALPPRSEQVRICAEVASWLSLIGQIDTAIKYSLIRAGRLRAATLSAAFSGNLT